MSLDVADRSASISASLGAMVEGGGLDRRIRSEGAGSIVLVIENDRELRESIQRVLESEGFQTLGADHGRSALDLLGMDGPLPAVILLDLLMPMMNGSDFLDCIEKVPRLARIPIIVVSAVPECVDRDRVSCWLRKPIDLDTLLEAVRATGSPNTGLAPERAMTHTMES
jgi:CheY-like chemotaxis protein